MIDYGHEAFGFSALSRVHGSAVGKAIVPALFSSTILIVSVFALGLDIEVSQKSTLRHPYAVQALFVFVTFLITFRANFAYGRYWEGATAIHQMLSKWMDSCSALASFHYQSSRYTGDASANRRREAPYAFGQFPHVEYPSRDRFRKEELTQEEMMDFVENKIPSTPQKGILQFLSVKPSLPSSKNHSTNKTVATAPFVRRVKSDDYQHPTTPPPLSSSPRRSVSSSSSARFNDKKKMTGRRVALKKSASDLNRTSRQQGKSIGKVSLLDKDFGKPRGITGIASSQPSPFLLEATHLFSLLSAVAFASLRHDLENAQVPLAEYKTGVSWPAKDPDMLSKDVRAQFKQKSRFWSAIYFILGIDRSDKSRTLYNASRPMLVLGGVSDAELYALTQARGPYGKVSLCTMWLQEFISREQLSGGTGPIPATIVSRCYQFVSDGMRGYNDARKVAFIPFPYPHAQITIIFVYVAVVTFPFLMYNYVLHLGLAAVLNFLALLCICGLHEVARELENPFTSIPNNLPLAFFQSQFNEALLTTCVGFHPDFWHNHPEEQQQQQPIIDDDALKDAFKEEEEEEEEEKSPEEPSIEVVGFENAGTEGRIIGSGI